MRLIARIGLTLAVMVAVAPATASAQSQPTLSKPWNHMFHRQSKKKDMADKGKHARAAIGVTALPFGAAVEIEAIVEIA